jgi:uncharacterized Ntn-hydrolase superfamily protein
VNQTHRLRLAWTAVILVALAPARAGAADMQGSLSIIALDRASGTIGIAVISDAPACGAEVPWLEAGVGAIATQGDVNPGWGPRGLALLRAGIPPQAVCDSLYRNDPVYPRRQVGVIDKNGACGGYTGIDLIGFSAGTIDTTVAVQGNSLSYTTALFAAHDTMFAHPDLPLPERLLHAITFGSTQTRGPLRSAALVVGRVDPERPESATHWISIRVDDNRAPVYELKRLYSIHAASRLVESHLHFAEQARRAGDAALEKAERARAGQLIAGAMADTTLPVHALNAMAWGLAQHGVLLDRAATAVDRALLREPKNRSFLDTASEIALRRGDKKAALDYAKRAIEIATRDEYLHERVKALEPTAGK